MYTVKKGGTNPLEHPEECGVTLMSSSSNQRKADEPQLSGHLSYLF